MKIYSNESRAPTTKTQITIWDCCHKNVTMKNCYFVLNINVIDIEFHNCITFNFCFTSIDLFSSL